MARHAIPCRVILCHGMSKKRSKIRQTYSHMYAYNTIYKYRTRRNSSRRRSCELEPGDSQIIKVSLPWSESCAANFIFLSCLSSFLLLVAAVAAAIPPLPPPPPYVCLCLYVCVCLVPLFHFKNKVSIAQDETLRQLITGLISISCSPLSPFCLLSPWPLSLALSLSLSRQYSPYVHGTIRLGSS